MGVTYPATTEVACMHQRSRERVCVAHKDAYNMSMKIIRVPRELNYSNVAEVLETLPLHKIQQKE